MTGKPIGSSRSSRILRAPAEVSATRLHTELAVKPCEIRRAMIAPFSSPFSVSAQMYFRIEKKGALGCADECGRRA
ncbi:hypothetical protein MesoLjLc_40520 [Mesorhizobium sp. L-8-10]|uniref:hypothetical protein n=1 Tax=Mesorhizobium sp. L-8-10 TaxID=2744523 RepID=UPI001928C759|nr:hypothetical protein [Mesorhizobium sp. L-8-10]BCH32122.1 hypothetical protein MesoLjLc_40520 [Mesorhizobium sp. L-8-10]